MVYLVDLLSTATTDKLQVPQSTFQLNLRTIFDIGLGEGVAGKVATPFNWAEICFIWATFLKEQYKHFQLLSRSLWSFGWKVHSPPKFEALFCL